MRPRKRKCPHCRDLFLPRASTPHHQRYCSRYECQRARKAENNRRFCAHNPEYFKDPIHAERVKAWRKGHPRHDCRPP